MQRVSSLSLLIISVFSVHSSLNTSRVMNEIGKSVLKHCPYALEQRSPTGGPREKFGGPWRNLDIICNFYVYYTVSLYSDSSSH
jgi:hypothetical protein